MASVYEPGGSVQAPSWWDQGMQQMGRAGQAAQQMPSMGRGGWGANFGTMTGPSENPHLKQGGQSGQFLGFSTAPGVSDSNVYASQGAGASGFSWDPNQRYLENLGSRSQQQMQNMGQWGQHQADVAQATALRGMNTPGGIENQGQQRWQQMMQGLQGMQQGMQQRRNRF
jgi:hypothetical protein